MHGQLTRSRAQHSQHFQAGHVLIMRHLWPGEARRAVMVQQHPSCPAIHVFEVMVAASAA